MNIARYIFGTLFLLGAVANTTLVIINGSESYVSFADTTFFNWYYDAWTAVAAQNITLIVILVIVFEVCLGMLFLIRRKYLKIALVLGILFCLASMPTMVQAIYTNLPLALIQGILLWKEMRNKSVYKDYDNAEVLT